MTRLLTIGSAVAYFQGPVPLSHSENTPSLAARQQSASVVLCEGLAKFCTRRNDVMS